MYPASLKGRGIPLHNRDSVVIMQKSSPNKLLPSYRGTYQLKEAAVTQEVLRKQAALPLRLQSLCGLFAVCGVPYSGSQHVSGCRGIGKAPFAPTLCLLGVLFAAPHGAPRAAQPNQCFGWMLPDAFRLPFYRQRKGHPHHPVAKQMGTCRPPF